MLDYTEKHYKELNAHNALLQVVDAIVGLKPNDVAPIKHGRWIEDGEDTMIGGSSTTCSECKDVYCCGDVDFETFAKFYKYCPNCGARMDGIF